MPGLRVPVCEVGGRVGLAGGGDGDDDVEAALPVLDRPPQVVAHLPRQLPQVNLHPAHPAQGTGHLAAFIGKCFQMKIHEHNCLFVTTDHA